MTAVADGGVNEVVCVCWGYRRPPNSVFWMEGSRESHHCSVCQLSRSDSRTLWTGWTCDDSVVTVSSLETNHLTWSFKAQQRFLKTASEQAELPVRSVPRLFRPVFTREEQRREGTNAFNLFRFRYFIFSIILESERCQTLISIHTFASCDFSHLHSFHSTQRGHRS